MNQISRGTSLTVSHLLYSPQIPQPNSCLATFALFIYPCLMSPCICFFMPFNSSQKRSHRSIASLTALLVWNPDLWFSITVSFFFIILTTLQYYHTFLLFTVSHHLPSIRCQRSKQDLVCLDHSAGLELGLEKDAKIICWISWQVLKPNSFPLHHLFSG